MDRPVAISKVDIPAGSDIWVDAHLWAEIWAGRAKAHIIKRKDGKYELVRDVAPCEHNK